MQLLSSNNMVTAIDRNATTEELLEAMFSVQSLYNKQQHAVSREIFLGRKLFLYMIVICKCSHELCVKLSNKSNYQSKSCL
jgi:hypothetical protein